MESLFKGYYQPTPEQFKELWEDGTVVFDTNVLLNLYRYKVDSRDEVLNIIKQIEDRVWIPYQVGLEFHRNRLTVLVEQNSSLSTIRKSIRDSIISIEKKCEDLDLDKRHSEIKTSNFIERFRELSESVINELDEIKSKKLTNDIDEDVVLTELTKLFSISKGSLGSPPKDQKVLEDIYKDGEFRAKNKIPPSFEDILKAQKNKSGEEYYAFEGLNYKKGFGDLIVWKQIIEFAHKNQKKNIIFVTDDTKEDWMRIINSHGKKTISARPELVSEIFKEAGVETFYIYDTNSFLDYSRDYFNVEVSDETIKDVKDVYLRNQIDMIEDTAKVQDSIFGNVVHYSNDSYHPEFYKDIDIIESWLKNSYLNVIRTSSSDYDFYGVTDTGYITPVIIGFSNGREQRVLSLVLEELVSFVKSRDGFKKQHIILAIKELDLENSDTDLYILDNDIQRIVENIINNPFPLKIKVTLTIGILSEQFQSFKNIHNYQIVL